MKPFLAPALLTLFSTAAFAQTPAVSPAVGTWFGIARACTSNNRFPAPPNTVDQNICRAACDGDICPASTFPVDEVTMMPQLFADGNVVATDHLSLLNAHTTGQGQWESLGPATIAGKTYNKVQASFMWLQPQQPQNIDPKNPWSIFAGMARPRFVMYLDPSNPDEVRGYLQAYLYNITDRYGVVNLQPNTPYPAPDPVAPLPATCDPAAQTNPYCAGTFMFVIRRMQPR